MRRGFGIRLLAGGIDALLGAVVAVLLADATGHWFAGRAIIMLAIGSPDTLWRGPVPMVLGIFGTFVYGLPFALLLVTLPEALFGASTGKWMLRMHVATVDGRPAPFGVRLKRWTVKFSGPLLIVLALLLGSAPVAAAGVACGAAIGAGFLLTSGRTRLAVHDRLCGTAVH